MRDTTHWARLLAFVTGLVNQELLLQNEYLVAENRILRARLPSRLKLSDPERRSLAEIGKRLGRKGLKAVACTAQPDTILAWYRRLVARKFDGSRQRAYPGRPRVEPAVEALVVRLARENSGWGYDRIVGALANLGHHLSDQTVGNILRRHDIAPAHKRSQTTTWKDFIRRHMDVLAGTDFFTVEVLSWRGLVTYYVLFFIHLETRRVTPGGVTRHPDACWMQQVARKRDAGGYGLFERVPLRAARSRQEVLRGVPRHPRGQRSRVRGPAGMQPQPELLRGALGALGQRRVPLQADLVRGSGIAESANPIRRTLSYRTQSPREGERSVIPWRRRGAEAPRTIGQVSRTPWRSSQVL
jgi:hypothetical protein